MILHRKLQMVPTLKKQATKRKCSQVNSSSGGRPFSFSSISSTHLHIGLTHTSSRSWSEYFSFGLHSIQAIILCRTSVDFRGYTPQWTSYCTWSTRTKSQLQKSASLAIWSSHPIGNQLSEKYGILSSLWMSHVLILYSKGQNDVYLCTATSTSLNCWINWKHINIKLSPWISMNLRALISLDQLILLTLVLPLFQITGLWTFLTPNLIVDLLKIIKILSNLSHSWRICVNNASDDKKMSFLNKTSGQTWGWKCQMNYNLERWEYSLFHLNI
jgi:hypothetical protein